MPELHKGRSGYNYTIYTLTMLPNEQEEDTLCRNHPNFLSLDRTSGDSGSLQGG